MFSRIIRGQTAELACVLSVKDWPAGFCMHTDASAYVQLGTWHYQAGKQLMPHAHKEAPRVSAHTQEVVYVVRGRLAADIFDLDDTLAAQVVLTAGDTLLIYAGGHGYSILDDDTKILEVKNGPYPGLEMDKRVLAAELSRA